MKKLMENYLKKPFTKSAAALNNRRGDTHFVAILVAIVIVVVLAVVFQNEMTTLFDGAFDKVNSLVDGLFA